MYLCWNVGIVGLIASVYVFHMQCTWCAPLAIGVCPLSMVRPGIVLGLLGLLWHLRVLVAVLTWGECSTSVVLGVVGGDEQGVPGSVQSGDTCGSSGVLVLVVVWGSWMVFLLVCYL